MKTAFLTKYDPTNSKMGPKHPISTVLIMMLPTCSYHAAWKSVNSPLPNKFWRSGSCECSEKLAVERNTKMPELKKVVRNMPIWIDFIWPLRVVSLIWRTKNLIRYLNRKFRTLITIEIRVFVIVTMKLSDIHSLQTLASYPFLVAAS